MSKGARRSQRSFACRRDDRVVAGGFEIAERLSRHFAVCDRRREVGRRVRTPIGRHRREVHREIHQRIDERLGAVAAAELDVLVAEELLGKLQHARLVGAGYAEDAHDHAQRIVERNVAGGLLT